MDKDFKIAMIKIFKIEKMKDKMNEQIKHFTRKLESL